MSWESCARSLVIGDLAYMPTHFVPAPCPPGIDPVEFQRQQFAAMQAHYGSALSPAGTSVSASAFDHASQGDRDRESLSPSLTDNRGGEDGVNDDYDDALEDDLPEDGEYRMPNSTGAKGKGRAAIAKKGKGTPEETERKIWTQIAKTQIPKVFKLQVQSTSSRLFYNKRLSSIVAREIKRVANRTKAPKEQPARARRVMREVSYSMAGQLQNCWSDVSYKMLLLWKGNEKKEREGRKAAEKAALDKARKEEELREAKRAARKLNFLITQTELYSHFVGSKIKSQ